MNPMRCSVFSLFPGMITLGLGESILKRAQEARLPDGQARLLEVNVHDLRDFSNEKHRIMDDRPFGGGAGMVLKAEPVLCAVDWIKAQGESLRLIFPSPQGRVFSQDLAGEFSREEKRLVFICGHYEGFDERVHEILNPEEISIGDYVLTGGELAALVMIDASARLIPGVLGDPGSIEEDSFSNPGRLLDYPHFTRPIDVGGKKVPEVLRSGHHDAIRKWRRREALYQTWKKRPDLLGGKALSPEDQGLLEEAKEQAR